MKQQTRTMLMCFIIVTELLITSSCGSAKISDKKSPVLSEREKSLERDKLRREEFKKDEQAKDAVLLQHLAAARPSTDQRILIELISADKLVARQIYGASSAQKHAAVKNLKKKYEKKRLSFESLVCVHVEEYISSYLAVFYVPDPTAGGPGTNRPPNYDFTFYNPAFVVKRNIPRNTALSYRPGMSYKVSGTLSTIDEYSSFDVDDNYNFTLFYEGVFPIEAANSWDERMYPLRDPELSPYQYRARKNHIENTLQDHIQNSYYGVFFDDLRIFYLN